MLKAVAAVWPCTYPSKWHKKAMCGRGAVDYSIEKIRAEFAVLGDIEINVDLSTPRLNVAPSDSLPLLRRAGGTVRLDPVPWGIRMGGPRPQTLLRSETVAHGRFARHERGIAVFSTFYEWQETEGTNSRPFAARARDGSLFALAAVVSGVPRCVLITQAALGPLAEIHDRMPVRVSAEHLKVWLDPQVPMSAALASMQDTQRGWADSLDVYPEDPFRRANPPRQMSLL